MFFFRHPKPVVDPRPVAEQSVQVNAVALPALTALIEPAPCTQILAPGPAELDVKAHRPLPLA